MNKRRRNLWFGLLKRRMGVRQKLCPIAGTNNPSSTWFVWVKWKKMWTNCDRCKPSQTHGLSICTEQPLDLKQDRKEEVKRELEKGRERSKRQKEKKGKVMLIGLLQVTVTRHQFLLCSVTEHSVYTSCLVFLLQLIRFSHLSLHLKDSAANITAVLILFSSVSYRICQSQSDLCLENTSVSN